MLKAALRNYKRSVLDPRNHLQTMTVTKIARSTLLFIFVPVRGSQIVLSQHTVKRDDGEDGDVEEDSWPPGGIDHGEDDGDDEDDHLHEEGPHDAARQGAAGKNHILLLRVKVGSRARFVI